MPDVTMRIKNFHRFLVDLADISHGKFVRASMSNAADVILETWKTKIIRHFPDGKIKDSLRKIETETGFLVESDWPGMFGIEEGKGAFDMKKALKTSPKVKRNMQGQAYLRIPIKHGMERGSEPDIRTMSEKSTGWIYPGQHGLHLLRNTLDEEAQTVNELIFQGIFEEIRDLAIRSA